MIPTPTHVSNYQLTTEFKCYHEHTNFSSHMFHMICYDLLMITTKINANNVQENIAEQREGGREGGREGKRKR